jgi:putative transposase
MCEVLGVARSSVYERATREPSRRAVCDSGLMLLIRDIHSQSRGTYGSPRVHAALARKGVRCGRKRVARLMKAESLEGVHRRRKTRTTIRDEGAAPAPDLVDRNFRVDRPDELWVTDITYMWTWEGWLYVAVVLDAFSRRVVGWSMADHLRTELVLDALDMALFVRRPGNGLVLHSDRGCQFTSFAFGRRLEEAGIAPSMGSAGDAYDNALIESFFATLETELLDRVRFKTRRGARMEIFDYIESFYNLNRLHSSLGYMSPQEFEHEYAATMPLTQSESV